MFSTYKVCLFFLGSCGSSSNLPKDERVWCFPLSQREDFSLAVWCRRWLNPYVHMYFKTQRNSFQSQCIHSLPEPKVTKHSKLGGLNNSCLLISQFWRLEVQNQDVGRTGSLKGIWKRICLCLSPHFLNPQLFYLFFTSLCFCACPHLCPNVSLYISETGWDLEPFTAMIARLACDKIQINYMGLKITVCMHSWGRFWTKDPKRPKSPTAAFEEPGAKLGVGNKTGCQEQRQSTEHAPCTRHYLRGGQTT